MKSATRRNILTAALSVLAVTLIACLVLRQTRAERLRELAQRQRTLRALVPDLERLYRYETIEAALLAAQPTANHPPAPPASSPPPDRRELKHLPVVGAWSGVQLELAWTRLDTAEAIRIVAHYTTNQPAWRVARLLLEAQDAPGTSRLQLLLESARPATQP